MCYNYAFHSISAIFITRKHILLTVPIHYILSQSMMFVLSILSTRPITFIDWHTCELHAYAECSFKHKIYTFAEKWHIYNPPPPTYSFPAPLPQPSATRDSHIRAHEIATTRKSAARRDADCNKSHRSAMNVHKNWHSPQEEHPDTLRRPPIAERSDYKSHLSIK